jgi:putative lumazine-binding protein/uncharacterized protein DUF1579
MKPFLLAILATAILAAGGEAQTNGAARDEIAAIRRVAQLYISAEPGNLREAFYPTSNLYTTDDKGGLRVIPFAEYLERVATNSGASRTDREVKIESVDRTEDAATVKISTVRPDLKITDYLSMLRIAKQWKIVSKTFVVEQRGGLAAAAQAQNQTGSSDNPCAAPDHHIFDFMIGTWHTSDAANGTSAGAEGESKVEPILHGCIIHEHRHITREGKKLFDGDVYWGYDVTTKRWLLFYLDDASHAQVYEGRQDGGHLAFYRERPDPDGKPVLIRIVYAPAGTVYTQAVERSSDHGATWQPGGITTYQPKR